MAFRLVFGGKTMDVTEAMEVVDEINDLIEEYDGDSDDARDFFDSVLEKADGILQTIENRGRVTDNQAAALENMLGGVRKWIR